MIDPYKAGHISSGPYAKRRAIDAEVDLREELDQLFITGEKKAVWLMYRRVRMNDKGLPVKHPDTQLNRNGEIPRDIPSIGSTSNGFLYDDHIVKGFVNHSQAYSITNRYKTTGESMVDYRTVYFQHDFLDKASGKPNQIPHVFDKIIRLNMDQEGNLISPAQGIERFDILSVDPYRLDNYGRVEYHRIRVISVIDESFQV